MSGLPPVGSASGEFQTTEILAEAEGSDDRDDVVEVDLFAQMLEGRKDRFEAVADAPLEQVDGGRGAIGGDDDDKGIVGELAPYSSEAEFLAESPSSVSYPRSAVPPPCDVAVAEAILRSAGIDPSKVDLRNEETARWVGALGAATASLPPEVRAAAFAAFSAGPTTGYRAEVLTDLAGSGAFAALPPSQQLELLCVLGSTTERGARLVAKLLESRPELLLQPQPGQDASVLSMLASVASATTLSIPADERGAYLEGVLRDIVNTGSIQQNRDALNCAPAAMQYELCRDDPAYYVSLMTQLALKGQAELKGLDANGQPQLLQLGNVEPVAGMSLASSVFQESASRFALGSAYGPDHGGLAPTQQQALAEALFGCEYFGNFDRDEVAASIPGFSAMSPEEQRRALDEAFYARVLNVLDHFYPANDGGPNSPLLVSFDLPGYSVNHKLTFMGPMDVPADQVGQFRPDLAPNADGSPTHLYAFRDPFGKERFLTADELRTHLESVLVPVENATLETASAGAGAPLPRSAGQPT